MTPGSSGSTWSLATTIRVARRGRPARRGPSAAERRGRQRHVADGVDAERLGEDGVAPVELRAELAEQARRSRGSPGSTSTYGGESTVRPAHARAQRRRPARRRPARARPSSASIVSGRAAMVAGTSGAAASPATIAGHVVDVAAGRGRRCRPAGARRRADLGDDGDAERRGVVAVLGRDDEVRDERWRAGAPAASCAMSSTGYTPSALSGSPPLAGSSESASRRVPSGWSGRLDSGDARCRTPRLRSPSPSIDWASSERDRTRWCTMTRDAAVVRDAGQPEAHHERRRRARRPGSGRPARSRRPGRRRASRRAGGCAPGPTSARPTTARTAPSERGAPPH